jgi:hypothetical protein
VKCTDPDCPCMEHKTPETHVACCNIHHSPLYQAEAGFGFCPKRTHYKRGREWVSATCGSRDMRGAVWLPRDLFNQSDLPMRRDEVKP